LTKKVKAIVDPALHDPSTNVVNLGSQIVVNAKGKRYSYRSTTAKGDTTTPMNREEIFSKFENCIRFGNPAMPSDRVREIFDIIVNLEKVEDVGLIGKLLL
jgi:2-methylcitrate dehydratase PrpD